MFLVVFVCTGNTCRSPMAEVIGRNVLGELGENVEVQSAGVMTTGGEPASNHSVFVVGERGGDLSEHRSQPVTEELARRADLLVAMTRDHEAELRRRFPQCSDRIVTLGHLAAATDAEDVIDPYGGSLEDYERTYQLLESWIRDAVPAMKERWETGSSA